MTCYAAGPDCDGPMQRHHVVKQQRIRKLWRSLMAEKRRGGPKPWSVTKALADQRNLVATCQRHHHEEIEMPLPDGFWDFVAEYGLEGALPRHLACGATAETPVRRGTVGTRSSREVTHLGPLAACSECGYVPREVEPGRWVCPCVTWWPT